MIVVPLLLPLLFLTFTGFIIGFISGSIAWPFFIVIKAVLSIILFVVGVFSSIPFSTIYPDNILPAMCVFLIISFLVLRKIRNLKLYFKHFILFFLVIVSLFFWIHNVRGSVVSRSSVYFFDIGQGDSALLTTDKGVNILIDGGSSIYRVSEILMKMRMDKVDFIILSHPHADHIGGLFGVVKRLKVGEVISSDYPESYLFNKFIDEIREKEIHWREVKKEGKIIINREIELFLYPLDLNDGNLNNSSLLVKVDYPQNSILFTGDAEKEALDSLGDFPYRADILKVPHHGGYDALNTDFLKKVKPKFALISVGEDNPFNHPSKLVIQELEKIGAKVLRTDIDKTVVFYLRGKDIVLKHP